MRTRQGTVYLIYTIHRAALSVKQLLGRWFSADCFNCAVRFLPLMGQALLSVPLLEFTEGTSTCRPPRVSRELQSELFLAWLGWTWTLQVIVGYISTKGSCHLPCSDSQTIICNFFNLIFIISCVSTTNVMIFLKEEMKIWCHLNSGATDFVRQWSFLLLFSPSSSSFPSTCS